MRINSLRLMDVWKMEAVAEGLWGLADHHEDNGEVGTAIKCLEAICQSQVSFLPIIEVKTRLRIATLLLKHSHNVNHAKAHLERAVRILLYVIPNLLSFACSCYVWSWNFLNYCCLLLLCVFFRFLWNFVFQKWKLALMYRVSAHTFWHQNLFPFTNDGENRLN